MVIVKTRRKFYFLRFLFILAVVILNIGLFVLFFKYVDPVLFFMILTFLDGGLFVNLYQHFSDEGMI